MKKPPARKAKKSKPHELEDLFAELKAEYLESFDEKITLIETLWQKQNRKDLQGEFHKIKGTGTTYGVREVSDVAEIMEDMCHQAGPKLGLSLMFSLEIFKRICANYIHRVPYEMNKDVLFKALRHMHDELESA